jgi:hypothetical protein
LSRIRALFACCAVGAAAITGAACATGDNANGWGPDAAFDGVPPPPDGGSDASTGGHDGGDAGDAGDGGHVDDAGDAGNGDATTAEGGATGAALAAGATESKSPSYSMVWTLGQGPGTNDTSHSPHFQIRGGVVGATQKP